MKPAASESISEGAPVRPASTLGQVNELLTSEFAPQETEQSEEQQSAAMETSEIDETLEGDEESSLEIQEEETLDETQDGETRLETVTELSEHFGIEPQDFYTLKVPLGDGQDAIPLSQLKDEYQKSLRERETFEQERNAFRQEQERFQQEVTQQQASPGLVTNQEVMEAEGLMRAIQAQYQSIDWEKAKETDAGQAAIYRQDLKEAYEQARQQRDQAVHKARHEANENQKKFASSEWQETVKIIPEWKSEEALRKDQAEMLSVMKQYGIRDNEFYQTVDHRMLHIMRDFTKLKMANQKADANAKRVRNAGVVVKPKGVRPPKVGNKKRLDQKLKNARGSKDRRVINDAVTDLLNSQT